jgi:hypothetical protein
MFTKNILHLIAAFAFLISIVSCSSKKKSISANPPNQNGQGKKIDEMNPKLTNPVVKKEWIPAEIKENGTVYEDGRWRYTIESGAGWTK